MGAPKQKWTAEEENALKAGVVKHGAGKWRTILKDSEFSGILSLRSNVDLKDKWRNMSVVTNGWGSREKARLAIKRSQIPTIDDNSMAIDTLGESFDDEIVDAKPLAVSSGVPRITGPKRSISRLDNMIMEAIITLKEPDGSNKTSIAMYVEDRCRAPPNFKRLLSAKLKALTACGKLIKVKRKYRITPSPSAFSEVRSPRFLLPEGGGRHREPSRLAEKDEFRTPTKSQIDAELAKMRNMTAQEAAAAAAQAVAEAEAAMFEAEEAAREAEAAEIDADVAQTFAEAAMMTLKSRTASNLVVPG